ncbi:unnamed protein product [Ilex paraguariensis]|uniref:CCT domain-containing protein n=1 Tax=Ilex paraguariensis TaxID=185542 RepID=A0ABC8T3Q9_9AQUA
MITTTTTDDQYKRKLNLFPLHPENLVVDRETQDENVPYIISAADGGANTITALLGTSGTSSEDENDLSPTYAYREQYNSVEGTLVRTAMKSKERDSSEEKKEEEVTSCVADLRYKNKTHQGLSLKLDYQEILNAWSDKGPLCIRMESTQTVPNLHDEDLPHQETTSWLRDRQQNSGGLWIVPEMRGCTNSNTYGRVRVKEDVEGGGPEGWKMVHREACVLRYKEKRQNRLFSKRIRYEVRKFNAEKRPRVKGRFAKRS